MKKWLFLFLPDVLLTILSILIASFVLNVWPFIFYPLLVLDTLAFGFDFYLFMKSDRRQVNLRLVGFLGSFAVCLALFLISSCRPWPWDFLIAFACAFVVSLVLKLDMKLLKK